jgi:hypothetical protein
MSLELTIGKKEVSQSTFLNIWVNPSKRLIRIENGVFEIGRYVTLYSGEINSVIPNLVVNYTKKNSIDGILLAKMIKGDEGLIVKSEEVQTFRNIFYLDLYFPKSSFITLSNNNLYFGLKAKNS